MHSFSIETLTASVHSLGEKALADGEMAALPIAFGQVPLRGAERLFLGYRRLRRHVYVEKTGIIDLTDGESEWDANDDRSIHFAGVERQGDELSVVGATRVIVKATTLPSRLAGSGLAVSAELLPSELEFLEFLLPEPSNFGEILAVEISRYIAEHPVKSRKLRISGALNAAVTHLILANEIEVTVAVVEDWLTRVLAMSGVSTEQISESRYLEKYKSENYVVRIDIAGLGKKLGAPEAMVVVPARAS